MTTPVCLADRLRPVADDAIVCSFDKPIQGRTRFAWTACDATAKPMAPGGATG
jgi:hypothetical protein